MDELKIQGQQSWHSRRTGQEEGQRGRVLLAGRESLGLQEVGLDSNNS